MSRMLKSVMRTYELFFGLSNYAPSVGWTSVGRAPLSN